MEAGGVDEAGPRRNDQFDRTFVFWEGLGGHCPERGSGLVVVVPPFAVWFQRHGACVHYNMHHGTHRNVHHSGSTTKIRT